LLSLASLPNKFSIYYSCLRAFIHFLRFDHLYLDIPPGTTAAARSFYGEVLGLAEVPGEHPKGALWFWAGEVQLHLREETHARPPELPAQRHAAFEVANLAQIWAELHQRGVTLEAASPIAGRQRFFLRDPFGNRLELLQFAGEEVLMELPALPVMSGE
jgi:catechol 2,3-dioxygenase-like lactoylglutathione lyase family enzyme